MQRLASIVVRVVPRSQVVASAACRAQQPLRRFASQPADASKEISISSPATASPTASPSPISSASSSSGAGHATPHAAPGSSAWQRLVAFTTGIGISSLWFYYTISQDVWHSTAVIENSLADFRGDVASTNQELRQRIATLEHQMASVKK